MTLWTKMLQWGDLAVSQVLPHRCIACGTEVAGPGFCTTCWRQLRFITMPQCWCCGDPFEIPAPEGTRCGACTAAPPLWHRARAVWRYDAASRPPVLAMKYRDRTALAGLAAPLLLRSGQALFATPDALLVPVPLHWTRLGWRGFNQAALLADRLHRLSGMPLNLHALKRLRRTRPQQSLDREGRMTNVRKAFAVTPGTSFAGTRVILVDDVLTSGATAAACTQVLLKAGATSVDVLTLARVVQPRALPI